MYGFYYVNLIKSILSAVSDLRVRNYRFKRDLMYLKTYVVAEMLVCLVNSSEH